MRAPRELAQVLHIFTYAFRIIYGAYTRISKWDSYGIALCIISLLMLLFQIIVYIYLRPLTKTGYYLNIVYLIITAAYSCAMYIQAYLYTVLLTTSSYMGIILLMIAWDVVYVALNLVYFKKEKSCL
jgi:hypothetical protein